MTIDCDVQYDNNPQGIFYVGQTLSGSVVLRSSEPEAVNGECNSCGLKIRQTQKLMRYALTLIDVAYLDGAYSKSKKRNLNTIISTSALAGYYLRHAWIGVDRRWNFCCVVVDERVFAVFVLIGEGLASCDSPKFLPNLWILCVF